MLDFVDETFNQMPFFVKMHIIFAQFLAFGSRRNNRFGLRDVVPLTSGQNKAQRIAQSIDTDVNFGTEATFAPA